MGPCRLPGKTSNRLSFEGSAHPATGIEYLEYLGFGEDGIVFNVQFGQDEPVAMKVVRGWSWHKCLSADYVRPPFSSGPPDNREQTFYPAAGLFDDTGLLRKNV